MYQTEQTSISSYFYTFI